MFPVSRLVVDPEHLLDDHQELMRQVVIGITYTRGSLRQPLREQPTQRKRQELLERYYIPHHQKLTDAVEESILADDHCLIIDGHSFPALPLPCELNQTAFRPDFFVSTDELHTPEELATKVGKELQSLGYSTA